MEWEGKGNGGPTYKGREVRGGGKGRGRVPGYYGPPGSRGARIVTALSIFAVPLQSAVSHFKYITPFFLLY